MCTDKFNNIGVVFAASEDKGFTANLYNYICSLNLVCANESPCNIYSKNNTEIDNRTQKYQSDEAESSNFLSLFINFN